MNNAGHTAQPLLDLNHSILYVGCELVSAHFVQYKWDMVQGELQNMGYLTKAHDQKND